MPPGFRRQPADPCNICGRPLPGKSKLQDCRGAWSDAAIWPASAAAANRRGPVWEFADRVQIKVAYARYGVAHWVSRSRLADRYAMLAFRSAPRLRGSDALTRPVPEPDKPHP